MASNFGVRMQFLWGGVVLLNAITQIRNFLAPRIFKLET